ncbi:MAG: FIST N-terminal domain-containing protein [Myxococcota bacterium]
MASIQQHTARTSQKEPGEAAAHLLTQLEGDDPKLVVLFASRDRDQRTLNRALRERLPEGTRLIGATTGGEIDREGIHQGEVVIGALSGDFEIGLGLGHGLAKDAVTAGAAASKAACQELGVRQSDLDLRKTVGLVIDDGFQFKKEEMLLGVLEKNQGLVLVGGGAGDVAQESSEIHLDGEVVNDAVLVALFQTDAPWAALRHHPYVPTGNAVTITKTDTSGRTVLEIDGQPAAQRYAELLDVSIDDLEFGKPRGFSQRSLALKVGREYFMRTPWKPQDDGSILFATMVEEDTRLEMMKLGDMGAMAEKFFDETVPYRCPNPQATLLFHCSGCQWVADSLGATEAVSEAFTRAPSPAGFNVFFEIYCGFHINTTLTTLAFGSTEAP